MWPENKRQAITSKPEPPRKFPVFSVSTIRCTFTSSHCLLVQDLSFPDQICGATLFFWGLTRLTFERGMFLCLSMVPGKWAMGLCVGFICLTKVFVSESTQTSIFRDSSQRQPQPDCWIYFVWVNNTTSKGRDQGPCCFSASVRTWSFNH